MADDNRPSGVRKNRVALTGNHVSIYVANQKIGYLRDFRIQNTNSLQELAGIGSAKVQENAPSLQRVSCSAARAVIMKDSLEKLLSNIAPSGTSSNPFLNVDGALEGLVFDIQVNQKDSSSTKGTTIRWVKGASIDSQEMQIGANAFFFDNVSMKALDVFGDMSGEGFFADNDMDSETSS